MVKERPLGEAGVTITRFWILCGGFSGSAMRDYLRRGIAVTDYREEPARRRTRENLHVRRHPYEFGALISFLAWRKEDRLTRDPSH